MSKKRLSSERQAPLSSNSNKPVCNKSKLAKPKQSKPDSSNKKPVKRYKAPPGTTNIPTEEMKAKVKRRANGTIIKGGGSNGGGRPKGSSLHNLRVNELTREITQVELEMIKESRTKKGKEGKRYKWLQHLIRKSYDDTSLAIALLARMYPALKSIEQVSFAADAMQEDEAEQIRLEMQRRCQTAIDKQKEKEGSK